MDIDLDAARRTVLSTREQADLWAGRHEDAIATYYKAGASLRDIAELIGQTVEGVRQRLLRRGVDLRPPHIR